MYLLSVLAVLVVISAIPIVLSDSMRGDFTIPNWVKNTAGWWADDKIPDSSFIETIEFLIKDEMITVKIPDLDSEVVNKIPAWVKNTAGWWAEDKVHDTTFVAAIKYLVSQGIVYVEREQVEVAKCNFKGKEVVCSPFEKEVEEITDFYMEVNAGSCSYCVNWAYVGDEYNLQIETYDEQHGKYIDGVEINAKIISKGGELRHDFGEVETGDGIYKNSIIIPSMDWYAENILSVTGEYFGVEKTIEKEFEVFKNQGGASKSYGAGAGGCAHVSPFSVETQDDTPQGIAFSKSGTKMFITGNTGDAVYEYTLTGAYCIGTASFVDSFSVNSQDRSPTGLAFSKSGEKMFVVGHYDDTVNEYTLTAAWDISTASFVDSFSITSQDEKATGLAFSKSGEKMFVVGNDGDDINEYTLATAWDVSSASFVDSFAVNSQEATPRDVWFDSSGKTMFIVGSDGDDVNVYKLATAWDVSTASFTG